MPTSAQSKTLSVSAYTVNDNNAGKNYAVTTLTNTTGVINTAPPFFTVPYDAILYLKPVGGTGGAATVFGIGTSTANAVPYFTGLPNNSQPNGEVQVGPVTAGTSLNFYMQSTFGSSGYAFSNLYTTDPASITAFSDPDHDYSATGNIVTQTGSTTWVLHLDDAVSYQIDDNDHDVLMQVRLAPTTTGTTTTTTTVTASTGTATYGQPVVLTATVTDTGPTPSGLVEFNDDTTGTDLGAGIQAPGTNTWTYTTGPTQLKVTGSADIIRATFTGTGTFQNSQGTLAGGEKITPAPLTITATTNTKTFDGTATAAASPTVSGLLGTDTVTGLTEVYSDPNVGSGKTLSVTAYTVNDKNAGKNYTVTTLTNTAGVINTTGVPNSPPFFTVPYDAILYLKPLGGSGGASTVFGIGTSTANAVPYFTGLPAKPNPNVEVQVGPVTAGTSLDFFMQSTFGSISGYAFSSLYKSDPASINAFSDPDHDYSPTGNVVTQTSATTWVLHLDDAISYRFDDNDKDVLMQVRLAPATTTTVTASAGTTAYGQTVVFTATVTAMGFTPTGSAEFYDDTTGTDLGAGIHAPGTNTWTYTTGPTQLKVTGSTDIIRAAFTGTGDFQNSQSTLAGGEKITPAPLTITATTNTKTYDSTTTAAATPQVLGLIGNDTVTGLAEAYSDRNAGSNKTLSVSAYTVNDGNHGSNYTVSLVSQTAGVINKSSLTITATTNTKIYDSTTSAVAVPTVSGLIGGDTATGRAEVYSDRNVGSNKAISVNAYTINDGNGGANYTVTTVCWHDGRNNQSSLSLIASTNTKTYDATVAAVALPTVSGLVGGDTVSGLAEVYDDRNAGAQDADRDRLHDQ